MAPALLIAGIAIVPTFAGFEAPKYKLFGLDAEHDVLVDILPVTPTLFQQIGKSGAVIHSRFSILLPLIPEDTTLKIN